jgi:hypothetical protein
VSDSAPLEAEPTGAAEPGPDASARPSTRLKRDADLLGGPESDCRKFLQKKIDAVASGFEDQSRRSMDLDQWWRIYNCEIDENQRYNGDSQYFVPLVRDAVDAQVTRYSNQLTPTPGRYVDVTSSDGSTPFEIMALIDHHLRAVRLKTQVLQPLLLNGAIEGQYNLYVDWNEVERAIVSRETHELPGGGEVDDITEEVIVEGHPGLEVLHDCDVLVIPQSADSIEAALAVGGSATIARRWSKDKYLDMADADEIEGLAKDDDGEVYTVSAEQFSGLNDIAKKLLDSIGIRSVGRHVVMFETWLMVPLGRSGAYDKKGDKRLCRLWWGISREPEGLKRDPYWNDRCPLLSAAQHKTAGVFKGASPIEKVAAAQYEANNAANERADTDHYSAMPMVRRTPGQGNKPIILNIGGMIDAEPGAIEFMAFPDLSDRARKRIQDATQVIFQSLSVAPAMLTQQAGIPGRKRSQAETAMELQAELLQASAAAQVPEENILTPLVEWIVDLDHQFRDRTLSLRAFGELGQVAQMIDVSPIRNRTQYSFRWCGSEQTRFNAQLMQQAIAMLNVSRGLQQPLQAEGYRMRIGPVFERIWQNLLGGDGRLVIQDMRRQLSLDPKIENQMMLDGHVVPVQVADNDPEHLPAHVQEAQRSGDPHGTLRIHIQAHTQQMQAKQQAQMMQMMQMMQGGAPGTPGGAGPGVTGHPPGPGAPQPGAQPAGPRLVKGPPGMIPPESMPAAGAVNMPRKF